MKSRILGRMVAALVMGAATVATAQVPFANEPVASASISQGPGADALNAIVQALNADESLKNAKITVQPDGGGVLLTGAALTQAQVQRAGEIANASANGAQVVNVVLPDHLEIAQPQQEIGAGNRRP